MWTHYESWHLEREYRKIVAAYDWFFHIAATHSFAQWRFGTVSSRMRDCSAFNGIQQIIKSAGMEGQDIIYWCIDSRVRDDFKRLVNGGPELMEPQSPLCYFADLGWSDKSPLNNEYFCKFHHK